eukprot:TRINITY_DN2850_c0_g1_i1.p1 TRINITY_DN2850_c0_g1~~TRINITY_DN2850_c0_g1_i1.p1  ORF type:complete len:518 (+),score=138.48 TRINITY_DN2850_c0_g1_i1:38-1591(+)
MYRAATAARWLTASRIGGRTYSSKIFDSADKAVQDVFDGATILAGGFGLCGVPNSLIQAVNRKGPKNLTVVSNNCGVDDWGLGVLLSSGQIKRMVSSYVGENKTFEKLYLDGNLELEIVPQGTLAERLRAGGAGIPAFYTPAGYGTQIHTGGFEIRRKNASSPALLTPRKEEREFNGKKYILEHGITGDFSLVKAWKADRAGNLVYRRTARNFNPPIASAGRITIAEVEELVDHIPADEVHTPSVYVNRIFCTTYPKPIEKRVTRNPVDAAAAGTSTATGAAVDPTKFSSRERMARRAAVELKDGMNVNLGIGIPTLAPTYLPPTVHIALQSENGLLGIGPPPLDAEVDPDLINAGKETITHTRAASFFGSDQSFAMIRGGHMDVTILGGMQVSMSGDLANWIIPGKMVKGPGGAMDLVTSGSRVVVTMEHVTKPKDPTKPEEIKILEHCKLPLTGERVVDLLITDLCVFEVDKTVPAGESGLVLIELAPGVTVDYVKQKTGCPFRVAENVRPMQYV